MSFRGGLVLCAVMLVLCVETGSSVNSSVKIRLTRKGLDYGSYIIETMFARRLKNFQPTNYTIQNGKDSLMFYNVQKRNIQPPDVKMQFSPQINGVGISLSNFAIDLSSNILFKVIILWTPISMSGSVDLTSRNVSVVIQVRFGSDQRSRPRVNCDSCEASIGTLDLKFSNMNSFYLGLVKDLAQQMMKSYLQAEICKLIFNEINVAAQDEISKMKVTLDIDNSFVLDYGLSGDPTVTSNMLEMLNKGNVYWKNDIKVNSGPGSTFPGTLDTSVMIHMWISESLVNTFADVAHSHKYIAYNLTQDKLPDQWRYLLNTSCSSGNCIGARVPEIQAAVPNSVIELRLTSSAAPRLEITTSLMTLTLYGNVEWLARSVSGTKKILTLNATLSLQGNTYIQYQMLKGRIANHTFNLNVVDSQIGNINVDQLRSFLGNEIRFFLIERLTTLGHDGVTIPFLQEFTFENSKTTLQDGVLLISTDITYLLV